MEKSFRNVSMDVGKQAVFLFYLIMYPIFWYFWLFAKNKKYTPNDMIKEKWRKVK